MGNAWGVLRWPFGKKFGRGVSVATARGRSASEGGSAHPTAQSSSSGILPKPGLDVTHRALVCREVDFVEPLIALSF